jgi:tetratricopeptide (TPR) repeat protein
VAEVTNGRGGVVAIVGEAGIGKSRLVSEVLGPADLPGAMVLEGRSLSVGQGLSYHPFVDLVRHWAGIGDDDPEAEAFVRLEAAIAALFAEQADEVLAYVATLMGLRPPGAHAERLAGIEGDALERLIAKSMRDLFQQIAQGKPLVLVFEDLHWADASSVGLLSGLLRLATEAPVLFVLLTRPDYPRTSQRVLRLAHEQHAAHTVELRLEPLDARACDVLIRNLVEIDDLPAATRALIARKADGNPFFIEEVVRSLIDDGVIEHRDGRFRVTERIESVEIPGTVQEVIMARLDRLPEPVRGLLQAAAVIGRTFPHRVIAAIAGRENHALAWELAYLKRRQLITEHRTGEEVEYAFKHALTQDTIYGSILHRTRRELHLKVAETIEALFAERLADYHPVLAYHFSRAEHLEKAEHHLFRAGDEAARTAASAEALDHFREASRLYLLIHGEGGDPARKALLEKNIGLALVNTGSLFESIDHFNRALGLLGEDVPQGGQAMWRRFAIDLAVLLARTALGRHAGRGRPADREILDIRYNRARAQVATDARRYFFDTVGSIRRLSETDPAPIEQACGMWAGAAALFAFAGASFAIGRRFLAVAEGLVRDGNVRDQFLYRSMRFVHHYLQGHWQAEHAVDEALVAQALRQGQLWDVNTYLDLDCERHIRQGAWAAAGRDIERMRELVEVYSYGFARSNLEARTASLLVEQRRLEGALEALDRYAGRDEELFRLLELGMRGKTQILLGDRAGAAATLARAEAIIGRLRLVPPYYRTAYLTNRLLLDLALLEEAATAGAVPRRLGAAARRSARRALRIARLVPLDRTEIYRLAGRLHWLLGRRPRALRWWARSIAAGVELGARPELARTYLEVGRRLTSTGVALGGVEGSAYLAQARALLAELALERDLEQRAA